MLRLRLTGLPEKILNVLHTAGECADHLGLKTYVVGGFVRDILLKTENWDVDLVVEGDGIAYATTLAKILGGKVKAIHARFGTALVVLKDYLKLDVATARIEHYPQPAALPQVAASGLKHDLYRRDFTINAMALQLNSGHFGTLIDFFSGQQDLRDQLIRVMHSSSFIDDPTRIFRAVRFEQRYHFQIEKDTEEYIRKALKLNLVSRLSYPRLFDELRLILDEEQPQKALARLGEWGALSWIHPRLLEVRERLRHFPALGEAWQFAKLFLNENVNRQLLYLMALLEPLTPAEIADLSQQCQFSREISNSLLQQKKYHVSTAGGQGIIQAGTPSQIHAQLRSLPTEVMLFEMAKSEDSRVKKKIEEYLTRWRYIRPLLTGKDLKKMHYSPGPIFVTILQDLLAARMDGKVVSYQDEIQYLNQHFCLPENPRHE